jgi:hypothetical protein
MSDYAVGDPVEVYSFGRWYLGTIVKVTPKRVAVDYTTGSGTRRVKLYSKADAGRLRPDTCNRKAVSRG